MANSSKTFHSVGEDVPRQDGEAKVTGRATYAPDVTLPGMWHGKVLRSPYPHAEVVDIDTSAAEEMGAICITFEDVPSDRYNERTISVPDAIYRDNTVLTDRPRRVGEGIAAVAAETEQKAEKALQAIDVTYNELDPVLDPEFATSDDAPALHETIVRDGETESIEDNIAVERDISVGNVSQGFSEADHVFEESFETGRTYHAQLENKTTVCRPEANGGITVWPTTQTVHNVRNLLGEIFELPLSKVNVKRLTLGGAFGSSIQTNSVTPITVALALAADKPVKISCSREEDMYDHCRYPTTVDLKIGVSDDGDIIAGEMDVTTDVGCHNIQAFPFLGVMAGFMASLYKFDHLEFSGRGVYTNKAPACAMQGFGNPQTTFVVESMIDMIAEELDIDQLELINKNYVGEGDTFWGQGPTIKSVVKSCGVEELHEEGAELIGWDERTPPEEKDGRYRRGIGMARGFHTSGTGGPTPGEAIDYSSAQVKINEDGTVDVVSALQDHGGGTLSAGAKIVAEELGVPLENVNISPTDSMNTAYDVATHATRGVYAGGAAMKKAAENVREQLVENAARLLDVHPDAVLLEPDAGGDAGRVYVEGIPEKEMTIGEVARTAEQRNWGTMAAVESNRQIACPPAYAAQFVEVEVDMKTGHIETVGAVLGNDSGTIVNPTLAAGQQHGGFYRGAGYALIEDTTYTSDSGQLDSRGFLTDYRMLTTMDLPSNEDTESFFVETEEPTGPFGAKGLGEACINPTAAAITNAIYNATGVRFTEIPVTPEQAVSELRQQLEDEPPETDDDAELPPQPAEDD
ncbi:xanthine dehydrogenase family protein molybdopterin-binding subunit [Natrarchaeobius halalkaliphilus]|uniref:Xanthine dehydrogenase family protein molybdopterin-binding subunit n=1 Tax=Natrarchaeobius halalkaliphilus TaxID=1679091 RepID=A0A3N6P0N1_9EURY|nr:molybdopterin cofactor-binding domain-containing protein [Natrarchaeobius halalkaliphilus]RQG88068.1 xanthine dehydrogenase family protein molybdopterin-binding subunit [Natrarchaeobius halalkaliphilus]